MRNEIKQYYEANFGPFNSITAAEIEVICSNESWLIDMPAGNFYSNRTSRLAELVTRKYLQARIKKSFKLIQN